MPLPGLLARADRVIADALELGRALVASIEAAERHAFRTRRIERDIMEWFALRDAERLLQIANRARCENAFLQGPMPKRSASPLKTLGSPPVSKTSYRPKERGR